MRFRNSLIGQNQGWRFIHPDVLMQILSCGVLRRNVTTAGTQAGDIAVISRILMNKITRA
jgi:hypothetical protein